MTKLPSFLVTLLIVGTIFEGNALKCYKGHFLDYEGGEEQSKLRLEDCEFSDEDVCVSGYAKTDFLDSDGAPVLAGSWDKYCESKSYLTEELEEFPTHGVYDRCFKSNAGDHLVMDLCICSTDGCNKVHPSD